MCREAGDEVEDGLIFGKKGKALGLIVIALAPITGGMTVASCSYLYGIGLE